MSFTVQLYSACYRVQRDYWRRIWPFRRGAGLAAHLARTITRKPRWVELEPGATLLLDPKDMISRVLLETGEWEPEPWSAIVEHLKAGGVFVDVGARISAIAP